VIRPLQSGFRMTPPGSDLLLLDSMIDGEGDSGEKDLMTKCGGGAMWQWGAATSVVLDCHSNR
jgi:hypothetical protein